MGDELLPRYDPAIDGERRSPQPLVYTPDQLLGRAPVRLRRAGDKRRFAAHVLAVVALAALTTWWVGVPHSFAGPVLLVLTRTHGVHAGDLVSFLFMAVAARSLLRAGQIVRARPAAVAVAER